MKLKVGLCVIFSLVLGGFKGTAQNIAFLNGKYEEGLKQAQKENKAVCIDFYATWCESCKYLDEKVFFDPEVAGYYNSHFVCVRIDIEKSKKLAERYQVQSIPTLVFLNAKGKEVYRIVGIVTPLRFLHVGQEINGDRESLNDLYKLFQKGDMDLATLQSCVLEAPAFVEELRGQDRVKWTERAFKLYADYVTRKGLRKMINTDDFDVFMYYHRDYERNDSVVNFINAHYHDYVKVVEPQRVRKFITTSQNDLIRQLARAGDLAYKEELERIDGDMRDAYADFNFKMMSVHDAMQQFADATYMLHSKKDEAAFLKLKDHYLSQLGDSVTFNDYNEAIGELVQARRGVLKPESYQHCLQWLDKAMQLTSKVKDRLQISCLMANCFMGLNNVGKAKACFNQAYVLAMQVGDKRMQAQIKAALDQIAG